MLKHFWVKAVSSIPLCYLTFSHNDVRLLSGILYILILDMILGIWVAIKYKKLSSNKMGRTLNKVGRYGIALTSTWILTVAEPGLFGWVFEYICIFILLTELFSNFEKLSLLGLSLPTKFLSKLNLDFKEFRFSGDKKKVAERIIDNRK